jgi:hypothetical protein
MHLKRKLSKYMERDQRLELLQELGEWILVLFVVFMILTGFWLILDIKWTRESQRWPLCVTVPMEPAAAPSSRERTPLL